MKKEFPETVAYNHFVELQKKVIMHLAIFLKTCCLGKCIGISYIDVNRWKIWIYIRETSVSSMEHSVNLGERLTRINKIELEKLFSPIIIDKEDKQEKELPKKYKKEDCYMLSQVSEKFGANPSTVTSIINPNNIKTLLNNWFTIFYFFSGIRSGKFWFFGYVFRKKYDRIFEN